MPTDDYKYTGVKDANNVLQEQIIQPSNFETVDYAFYDFISRSHLNLNQLVSLYKENEGEKEDEKEENKN